MTGNLTRPRPHRIDRTLWPVVAKRRRHLTLMGLIVAPVLAGLWLPETPAGLLVYAAHCVVVAIVVVMIQRSRDRWLSFREYLRSGPGPR
jgi:hypothetical protein